ncbi:MAG: hypothetical protein AB7P12_00730 [Alphaproteobacteria bacterium]
MSAVAARLAAITEVAGLTVERDRRTPVMSGELPFLAVYEGPSTSQSDFSGEQAVTLTVSVEGLAGGVSAQAARDAAGLLRAQAEAALFADVTLGGLARDLRPSDEPPPPMLDDEIGEEAVAFVFAVDVDFATREGDPFSFA